MGLLAFQVRLVTGAAGHSGCYVTTLQPHNSRASICHEMFAAAAEHIFAKGRLHSKLASPSAAAGMAPWPNAQASPQTEQTASQGVCIALSTAAPCDSAAEI